MSGGGYRDTGSLGLRCRWHMSSEIARRVAEGPARLVLTSELLEIAVQREEFLEVVYPQRP